MIEVRLPQRPADQYSSGWWRRVKVAVEDNAAGVAPAERKLRFTVLTERARAEEEEQMSQRKLIDNFISEAINRPVYDENLCSTIFELMVPNVYKDQVISQGNLLLVVDDQAANYPWELMAARTRSGVKPLAAERGLIRQLVTGEYRPNPQAAQGRNALVIGDPILDDPRFAQLPGARDEASMVANMLGTRFDVTPLVGSKPLPIISTLFEKDYRIIHLAGHGHYDSENPFASGMVLGEGLWLSAAEFRQMRIVPDLVFINCCHLGVIDGINPASGKQLKSANRLAASVSQELIRMGVRAVVAAGWAVDDGAAVTFAQVFYESLITGNETFGDAVLAARQKVYELHRSTNTWGAYQCYGNPDFRLNQMGGGASRFFLQPLPRSKREFRNQLHTIAEKAVGAVEESRARLIEQLSDIERSLPPIWADGELLSLLGEAWAALGDFDKGIDRYRRALTDEKGKATLHSLQQYANLLARYARSLTLEDQKAPPRRGRRKIDPDHLFAEAENLLQTLLGINPTVELLSIFGSFYKNRARIDQGRRIGLFRQAADCYKQAYDLSIETTGLPDPYPGLNWMTCRFIADQLSPARAKGARARQAKSIKSEMAGILEAAAKSTQSDDLWKRIYLPDAELFNHLIGDTLNLKTAQSVIEKYRFAVSGRADQRQIESIRGQFDLLIEILSPAGDEPKIDLLVRIRDAI